MRQATCSVCGSEQPSGEMFALEGKPICAACAAKRPAEAKAAGEKLQLGRIVDTTVCSVCHADQGQTVLPLIGGLPVCANCAPKLYSWPFPLWLKAGMAVLLVLLSWALWHGRHYFAAGRHMVIGERALDRHDYRRASDEFVQALKFQPGLQKATLLGAKANFLAGDPESAMPFFSMRDHYEHDTLYNEVNGMFKRSVDAVRKARRAVTLDDAGKYAEAAQLMNEASQEYPQAENLGTMAAVFNARAAFYSKDYDAALKFSDAAWHRNPNDPNLSASLASALACKYAVTGDPQFRTQAEQMLAKARELSDRSPADHAAYLQYSPRIVYRLESRQIIDNAEYDRRFGQKGAKP